MMQKLSLIHILFGKSEEFRRVAPYFPEEVFEHLPDLLAQGVKAAGSYRERDMLLMAMITNILSLIHIFHPRY